MSNRKAGEGKGPYKVKEKRGFDCDRFWFVAGPGMDANYFCGKGNAVFWRDNMNTAYFAGRASVKRGKK